MQLSRLEKYFGSSTIVPAPVARVIILINLDTEVLSTLFLRRVIPRYLLKRALLSRYKYLPTQCPTLRKVAEVWCAMLATGIRLLE